jgi:hypothetical protein
VTGFRSSLTFTSHFRGGSILDGASQMAFPASGRREGGTQARLQAARPPPLARPTDPIVITP